MITNYDIAKLSETENCNSEFVISFLTQVYNDKCKYESLRRLTKTAVQLNIDCVTFYTVCRGIYKAFNCGINDCKSCMQETINPLIEMFEEMQLQLDLVTLKERFGYNQLKSILKYVKTGINPIYPIKNKGEIVF